MTAIVDTRPRLKPAAQSSSAREQVPNYLVHHLLLPNVLISRKLELRMDLGLEPRHSENRIQKSKLSDC